MILAAVLWDVRGKKHTTASTDNIRIAVEIMVLWIVLIERFARSASESDDGLSISEADCSRELKVIALPILADWTSSLYDILNLKSDSVNN